MVATNTTEKNELKEKQKIKENKGKKIKDTTCNNKQMNVKKRKARKNLFKVARDESSESQMLNNYLFLESLRED